MLRIILTLWVLAMGIASHGALATEDAHFIQSDDYFIGERDLENSSYIYVHVAKMTTAPSSSARGEGEFMRVRDGQSKWTRHIWRSRIAAPGDLKLGQTVIVFEDHAAQGVYEAPRSKTEARGRDWFYAKITDLTDTYKGYVTVSGNYKVGLNNLRIPIPYGMAEAPMTVAPVAAPPAPAPAPKTMPVEPVAAPMPDMPWNGGEWVEVRFGGCDVPNVRRSKQAVPDDDFCTAQLNGKVAICNADNGGCLYKNVTPKQCKDGSQPGRMFVCTPK